MLDEPLQELGCFSCSCCELCSSPHHDDLPHGVKWDSISISSLCVSTCASDHFIPACLILHHQLVPWLSTSLGLQLFRSRLIPCLSLPPSFHLLDFANTTHSRPSPCSHPPLPAWTEQRSLLPFLSRPSNPPHKSPFPMTTLVSQPTCQPASSSTSCSTVQPSSRGSPPTARKISFSVPKPSSTAQSP